VPELERRRVVEPNVLHVHHGEVSLLRRLQHDAHAWKVASGEDVAPDEVRAAAVVLVVLVFVRDRLDHGAPARLEHAVNDGKVLKEVLVPDRLDHLDRDEAVKGGLHVLHLAVVAEFDGDAIRETLLLDALARVRELLLADGDPRDFAAGALHRAQREAAPPAADLEDVALGRELELVDDQVELVQLRLIEGVGRGVENARGVPAREKRPRGVRG
jgi:hypothetical protein